MYVPPPPQCYPSYAYVRAGATTDLAATQCPDDARRFTVTIARQPDYGQVEVVHDGLHDVLRYTASATGHPGSSRNDSFAFTVGDGSDTSWPGVSETVLVVPDSTNYAPQCFLDDPDRPGARTAVIESNETLPLVDNCTDGEDDPFTARFAPVTFGDVRTTGDGTYLYTPPATDPGPDGTVTALSLTATDDPQPPATATPLTSQASSFSVRVIRADHDPVCTDQIAVITENSGGTAVPAPCTDADPGDTLSVDVPDQPADLTAIPASDVPLTLDVTPRRDFTGVETVAFTASDGDDTSPPATLTVMVVPRDHAAAQRRQEKLYLRAVAPAVLRAVRHGWRVGPLEQPLKIEARVAGASTTLAAGSLRLAPGSSRALRLRFSRSGRILRHRGRLHGHLTVTVGTDGVSARASGVYR